MKSGQWLVVKMRATWCAACKAFRPTVSGVCAKCGAVCRPSSRELGLK